MTRKRNSDLTTVYNVKERSFFERVSIMVTVRDYVHGKLKPSDRASVVGRPFSVYRHWIETNYEDEYFKHIDFNDLIPILNRSYIGQAFAYSLHLKPYTDEDILGSKNEYDQRLWEIFQHYKFSGSDLFLNIIRGTKHNVNNVNYQWVSDSGTIFEAVIYLLILGKLKDYHHEKRNKKHSNNRNKLIFPSFNLSTGCLNVLAKAIQFIIRSWDDIAKLLKFKSIELLIQPYILFDHSTWMYKMNPSSSSYSKLHSNLSLFYSFEGQTQTQTYKNHQFSLQQHQILRKLSQLFLNDLNHFIFNDHLFKRLGNKWPGENFMYKSSITCLASRFDQCINLLRSAKVLFNGLPFEMKEGAVSFQSNHPFSLSLNNPSSDSSSRPNSSRRKHKRKNVEIEPSSNSRRIGTHRKKRQRKLDEDSVDIKNEDEEGEDEEEEYTRKKEDEAEGEEYYGGDDESNESNISSQSHDQIEVKEETLEKYVALKEMENSNLTDENFCMIDARCRRTMSSSTRSGLTSSGENTETNTNGPSSYTRSRSKASVLQNPENPEPSSYSNTDDKNQEVGDNKNVKGKETIFNEKNDESMVSLRVEHLEEGQLEEVEEKVRNDMNGEVILIDENSSDVKVEHENTKDENIELHTDLKLIHFPAYHLPNLSLPPDSIIDIISRLNPQAMRSMVGTEKKLPHKWTAEALSTYVNVDASWLLAIEGHLFGVYKCNSRIDDSREGLYADRTFRNGDLIAPIHGGIAYECDDNSIRIGINSGNIKSDEQTFRKCAIGLPCLKSTWSINDQCHKHIVKRCFQMPADSCIGSKVINLYNCQYKYSNVQVYQTNAKVSFSRKRSGISKKKHLCDMSAVKLVATRTIHPDEEIVAKFVTGPFSQPTVCSDDSDSSEDDD